jgi:PucR-like helix-turn-helix protein/diguanylate cyclase with GGDEF domain
VLVPSATLQELVEDLAQRLNAPAVIEDDELRMVAYSPHGVLIDDIRRDSILVKHAPATVSDWLPRFGLQDADGPVRIPGDHARGILGRLCVPVSYRGARLGYLWLIDDDQRLGSTQVRTAARAADQAGLLMFGNMLGERMASGVLAHLLSPVDELRADAMRHIDDSGLLGLRGPVIAVVVRAVGAGVPLPEPELAESLRDVTRGRSAGTVIGLANPDHGVLVAHDQGAAAGRELAAAVRASLLLRLQADNAGASVVAGIGDPSVLADARVSYRQAKQAARVAATIGRAGPVARWHDLGVYRTLAQLPVGAEAAASLDPRLATLLDSADGPVITTLETYLDLAGDAKASAERLSLHRGTLYYRLQKAEQIAGVNLRNGCDRLALHLGFKLARLTGLYPKQAHGPAGPVG